MIGAGEDELFCDFAETYGILEPRALGAKKMAVLACGLRDDSRIKQKLVGTRIRTDTQLLASAVDFLALLAWRICCKPGAERPASVLAQLEGGGPGGLSQAGGPDGAGASLVIGFDTAEDFEAARSRILKQAEKRQGEEAEHGN